MLPLKIQLITRKDFFDKMCDWSKNIRVYTIFLKMCTYCDRYIMFRTYIGEQNI